MPRKFGVAIGFLVAAAMALAASAPVAGAADLPGGPAAPASVADAGVGTENAADSGSTAPVPAPTSSPSPQGGPAAVPQESEPSGNAGAPAEVSQAAADIAAPPPAPAAQPPVDSGAGAVSQAPQQPLPAASSADKIAVAAPPRTANLPAAAKPPPVDVIPPGEMPGLGDGTVSVDLPAAAPKIDAAGGPSGPAGDQFAAQLFPGGNDGGGPPLDTSSLFSSTGDLPPAATTGFGGSVGDSSPPSSSAVPIPQDAKGPRNWAGATVPGIVGPRLPIVSLLPSFTGPQHRASLSHDFRSGKGPATPPMPPGHPGLGGPDSSGFVSFGLAALLIAAFSLPAVALGRRLEGALARCRPVPFLSLLERPG